MSRTAGNADPIPVAACVVRAPDGLVLMARRTPGQISPGFWELPGGKVDPGETPAEAAVRELDEEVGLRAQSLRPLIVYDHAFPLRRIRLNLFLVDRWSGEARGREGQALAWVDPAAPTVSPVLPSNTRVLAALALPKAYPEFSCRQSGGVGAALDGLRQAFAAGVRLVRLDGEGLTPDQRVLFARRAAEAARPFGARVLLAGSALEARRAGVAGVHSPAGALPVLTARPAVGLWAATCRDEGELNLAIHLGADLAVLEPAGADASPARLGDLAARAPIPLYARAAGADAALMAPWGASR